MEVYDFDLYEALEVQPDASEAEIRKAYRRLALVHHPDRTGGQESAQFLRVKTAHDVLVDRDKRVNYDSFHKSRAFARDRRPLTAKEAAWLVDQQKRAWGVREIHPFAVCILCDSCPCPADGVCFACGMHFCQMCVRKMHARDGIVPHYPVRQSNDLSKKLAEQGHEKDKERKLLKGSSNQWLMDDQNFRHHRDVYRERCRRGAPELCHYWAWGQTKYTVHLAFWLASEACEAEVEFRQGGGGGDDDAPDDELRAREPEWGAQRIAITPAGQPTLLERAFAYGFDATRAAEALTFSTMHCMTLVMVKATPGERWRRLFVGDSDGHRELRLGRPAHSVTEEQVDGFKPANHHRVAQRKETASERYEVTVNVAIPEAAERRHVDARIGREELRVAVAGWGVWQRRLQRRELTWEDQRTSRSHVDTTNSTWLLARDAEGRRCVQFVLSDWREGANKNQEQAARRQLQEQGARSRSPPPPPQPTRHTPTVAPHRAAGARHLLEDADPLHMYDLVEADMFLRSGAVFKARSALAPKARPPVVNAVCPV